MSKITLAAALITGLAFSGSANALETRPILSLDAAKKMADACEAMATEKGWRMYIAVVDAGANLLYFRHMVEAYLVSIDISIDKAKTSAMLPISTRIVADTSGQNI
ncbi:MAG: GlcG/HbpS family heme-binding protein [Alphaproteobacteria bacterium]|jgi:uncharacterized protein GlcG (DUF336 family)